MTDKHRLAALKACADRYRCDLNSFDDGGLINQESEVSDRIDTETDWHEAVCAEIELRGLLK